MKASKAAAMLDAAERLARGGGYNGFSFRDVAEAVGVKSAAVHYHFPTKADLGAALARRYTDRFLEAIGDPSAEGALERYAAAFRRALVADGQMCLCGLFSAEIDGLPPKVAEETRAFLRLNLVWLERALTAAGRVSGHEAAREAAHVLAALEGGLLIARALGESAAFDRVADALDLAA